MIIYLNTRITSLFICLFLLKLCSTSAMDDSSVIASKSSPKITTKVTRASSTISLEDVIKLQKAQIELVKNAIKRKAVKELEKLLDRTNIEESCFLHYASKKGFSPVIQLLLDRGANIRRIEACYQINRKKKINSITPLGLAAYLKNYTVVKQLALQGAEINKYNIFEIEALAKVFRKNSKDAPLEHKLMSALFDNNVENFKDSIEESIKSSLTKRTSFATKELINIPKDSRLDFLNDKNEYGKTVLMLAAMLGRENIVRLLIGEKYHAKSDITDNAGNTAAMLARKYGHTQVAKIFEPLEPLPEPADRESFEKD